MENSELVKRNYSNFHFRERSVLNYSKNQDISNNSKKVNTAFQYYSNIFYCNGK